MVQNRRNARKKKASAKPTTYKSSKARADALENRDPEKAGELLAWLVEDPNARVGKLAQAMGLSEVVVQGMVKRFQTRYVGLKSELHRVTNKDLIELLEDRAFRMLSYMTDDLMAAANLRDLTQSLDKVIGMRQLLKGQPTQIISVEDRKKLSELAPRLLEEMERRGAIDGEFREVKDVDGERVA